MVREWPAPQRAQHPVWSNPLHPNGRTTTTLDRKLPQGELTTRWACILAGIEKERLLGELVKAHITRLTDAQRAGMSSAPRRTGRSTVPTRPRHSCL